MYNTNTFYFEMLLTHIGGFKQIPRDFICGSQANGRSGYNDHVTYQSHDLVLKIENMTIQTPTSIRCACPLFLPADVIMLLSIITSADDIILMYIYIILF